MQVFEMALIVATNITCTASPKGTQLQWEYYSNGPQARKTSKVSTTLTVSFSLPASLYVYQLD